MVTGGQKKVSWFNRGLQDDIGLISRTVNFSMVADSGQSFLQFSPRHVDLTLTLTWRMFSNCEIFCVTPHRQWRQDESFNVENFRRVDMVWHDEVFHNSKTFIVFMWCHTMSTRQRFWVWKHSLCRCGVDMVWTEFGKGWALCVTVL